VIQAFNVVDGLAEPPSFSLRGESEEIFLKNILVVLARKPTIK